MRRRIKKGTKRKKGGRQGGKEREREGGREKGGGEYRNKERNFLKRCLKNDLGKIGIKILQIGWDKIKMQLRDWKWFAQNYTDKE